MNRPPEIGEFVEVCLMSTQLEGVVFETTEDRALVLPLWNERSEARHYWAPTWFRIYHMTSLPLDYERPPVFPLPPDKPQVVTT